MIRLIFFYLNVFARWQHLPEHASSYDIDVTYDSNIAGEQACRDKYQAQQATNPNCSLAQKLLLDPANRVTYQFNQDYQCAN
jgi:hypothetical protein